MDAIWHVTSVECALAPLSQCSKIFMLIQDTVTRAAHFNRNQARRVVLESVLGASEPGYEELQRTSQLWTVRSLFPVQRLT